MSAQYSYTNLKDAVVDPIIFPNIGSQITILNYLNKAARFVASDIDLRSMKRKSTITPNLFDDIYEYTSPSDLNGFGVIDIIAQVNRSTDSSFVMVTPEFFDRKKSVENNIVTVFDSDFVRKLKINSDVDDDTLTVSGLDSLSDGGGTWVVRADAANLAVDDSNYVSGGGSLKFDLTGSATTAGITNENLNDIDITDYINNGSGFTFGYINSTTNITNYILEIGDDTSNYYKITITIQNDGNAFREGWNLFRFSFANKTTTGTPTNTSTKYCSLYMTKSSGKSDDGYRFDDITLHTGEFFDVLYYSRYPWQNSSGTYIENSSATGDKLNADTDEFDLFVARGKYEMARELRDYDQMKIAKVDYDELKKVYQVKNPSERLISQIFY